MAQDVTIDIKFKILSDINKKVDKIEKSFVGLEKQTTRTSKSLAKLGTAIAGFVGARALLNFTKDAVLGFAQFEKAVIEVNTLLPETQKNVKGLTKQLSDLSVEFGTDRISQAKGLYQTISSGFTDAAESAKILAASNVLALGGLTDIRTAVGGVTAVLKSYGRGSESASKVTDIFFQTIKNARTTAEELGQSISVVTGLGANLGISFESLSAALGTLTLNGTDTATAAVQLRQILASILKPSAEARQEAKRLGIEFSAAAVRSQGLGKFLLDLRKKLDGNDDSVAKLFGNVRALSGIIQLTSGDLANYNKLLEDNENALGAAAKAAEEVKKSTDFKLKVLNAQWTRFKDLIGDGVVNALFDMAKAYEDTINRIDKASKEGSFFANLAKGFLATIGVNVEKQAGNAFTGGGGAVASGGTTGQITPGGDFTGVSTGFFTALDSFAVAFKDVANKAANAVGSVFSPKSIAGFLKGGAGGARALAKNIGNAVGAAFGVPGAGELVELLSLPPEKFRELIDQFFKAIPQIIEAIATNIPVLIEAFVENIDPIIDALVGAVPIIVQKLLELLVDPNFWVKVFNSFLSILTLGIFDSFKPVISVFQGIAGVFAGAVSGFNSAINFFKDAVNSLKDIISSIPGAGGGGGIVSDVINFAKSLSPFANGGDVPNLTRFNNDNFPARLSAGEAVITASTTDRLNKFLDQAEAGGSSQPIVIQTVVGEETLAETITNLDLKGYRLGGVF